MYGMRIKSIICAIGIFVSFSAEARTVTVTRVIDGDTIVVNRKEHVRLIGIDSPESFNNRKAAKDSLRTGVPVVKINEMGERSKEYLRDLVQGKRFKIVSGHQKLDKYGRRLAYLETNHRSVNETMVENGFACAYLKYPFERRKPFVAAQDKARLGHAGLWADGLNCN